MDEIVLRAMAKWPDVPAVYGWLALDRRGNWLLKGGPISNSAVSAFIGRNFARDDHGRWFFQNGPQRVYIQLEYTPLVLRVVEVRGGTTGFEDQSGRRIASVDGAWLDESGSLVLLTNLGPGVVDDRDLARLTPSFVDVNGNPLRDDVLEELIDLAGRQSAVPLWLKFGERSVKTEPILSRDVPSRFFFDRDPAAQPDTAARVE